MPLESFERDNRFFIKFFLLDASTNQNNWGVTAEALVHDLKTFLGTPFVITENFDHPDESSQESYRKGTIIDVGIDQLSGKAYGVAEITDKQTIELIRSGEIQFVSPSLATDDKHLIKIGDREYINEFIGQHIAGVKKPAFGIKAQIKGQCTGSSHECKQRLMFVQACTCNLKKEQILKIADEHCVEKWISELKEEHPDWPDDKIKAVAISKCENESASINSLKVKTTQNNQNMSQENILDASKLEAQIKELTTKLDAVSKENGELKTRLDAESKKPFVEKIISAKIELGKIKEEQRQVESDKLYKLEKTDLEVFASELETIITTKKESAKTPYIRYQASEGSGKKADDIVLEYKRLTS